MRAGQYPGQDAVASKGWWAAHKWLLLRRVSQLGILGLFLLGPWFGIWIVEGSLASSLTLEVLPLTDPYLLLQMLLSGGWPMQAAWIGAAIVVVFYLLVGGRSYCAWVCPVNIITDVAAWLNRRLGFKSTANFSRSTRYWILALTLLLALLTGSLAWELVNPVSSVYRGLVFGTGFAWLLLVALFLFDAFVSRRGWCSHLCPVGAFYSLLGKVSVVRVSAVARARCNDCMDCFEVCPEPQVIRPALKGEANGAGPVILSPNCTNCGRCIDVCSKDVFRIDTRFNNSTNNQFLHKTEVAP
ncbi:MAG: quinol dehydrogenase ferredoxin subunit NapH [Pseudomonadota bacterium]